MDAVLEVRELRKSFLTPMTRRRVEALKGVTFSIPAGQITGFLGANGAGKTTSIKCILELAFPDSGEIFFFGQRGLSREAKARIGFLPERPYFYDYLTGREFLTFYAKLSGRVGKTELPQRVNALLERVGLGHAKDRPLRGYSKGMLQRVGIAQALIHRPEFVILDEPMTGLDPDGRFEVRELIKEVAAQGTAVFFSSHLLPDAETLCQRLVILKKGELLYQGPTSGLFENVDTSWRIVYRPSESLRKANSVETQQRQVATVTQVPNEVCELEVHSVDELQKQIDALRASGSEIREVGLNKMSLEEIFVKMAFDRNPVSSHSGEAVT